MEGSGSRRLTLSRSIICLNTTMEQRRPAFPGFPEQCRLGHPWKPGTVAIDWRPCECRTASAARGGHIEVRCGARGCAEVWQRPQHEPLGILGHHRPGH